MITHGAKRKAKAAKPVRGDHLDEQVEETFPASDPPAFMGGKTDIGRAAET